MKEDRAQLNAPESSWEGNSAVFSHDDDVNMLDHEADKMSLDGSLDGPCSSSEAPSDADLMDEDVDDVTDDEDWAAIGAAALRAESHAGSGPGRQFLTSHLYRTGARCGGGPPLSALSRSVPPRADHKPQHTTSTTTNFDFSALGMTSDSQEREAVEALLRLGSV
jgi:hypothetical protein